MLAAVAHGKRIEAHIFEVDRMKIDAPVLVSCSKKGGRFDCIPPDRHQARIEELKRAHFFLTMWSTCFFFMFVPDSSNNKESLSLS